jgi:hypothetical protein
MIHSWPPLCAAHDRVNLRGLLCHHVEWVASRFILSGASCAVVFSARAAKHRKRPVEAAGAVDAKNAPTAPWKTGRPVFNSYHRLPLLFSGNRKFVTHVPGLLCYRCSRLHPTPSRPDHPTRALTVTSRIGRIHFRINPVLIPNERPAKTLAAHDAVTSAVEIQKPDFVKRATANTTNTGNAPSSAAASRLSRTSEPRPPTVKVSAMTALHTSGAAQYLGERAARSIVAETATRNPNSAIEPSMRSSTSIEVGVPG